MSKFFVGQRVRLVKSESGTVPIGTQGEVVAIGPRAAEIGMGDCSVVLFGVPCPYADSWVVSFYQLEPILPDGAQPGTLSYQELMDECREGVAV